MATSTGKTVCVRCEKEKTTSKCSGCLEDFCFNHLVEHRQQLEKQFDNLENERNIFRQTLTEQKVHLEKNIFIKQINHWEQKSIKTIRQTAEEQRQRLFIYINSYATKIETKLDQLTQQLKEIRNEDDFNEVILRKLQTELKELEIQLYLPPNASIKEDSSSFVKKITVVIESNEFASEVMTNVSKELANATWKRDGVTIIGAYGRGNGLDQINESWCFYIDRDQSIYVSDSDNHRIVEWKKGACYGRIVAGGMGPGDRNDQLNCPENIIIDYRTDSFIICDRCNRRVVRWPRSKGTYGETIISNISCSGLAMDDNGYLYVSDINKQEVRRWKIGEKHGKLVAGGNGNGSELNQLNEPRYIHIDEEQAVYVSDCLNNRVMKWTKDAKEGIIVAGEVTKGSDLSKLHFPQRIIVDKLGSIYIADAGNDRLVRWLKGAKEGSIVLGGNGEGFQSNQFDCPTDFVFDQEYNIYVLDRRNYRIQKFFIN